MNPVKVICDFGRRAPLLHIKDGPARKGPIGYEKVSSGEGIVDFPNIVEVGG